MVGDHCPVAAVDAKMLGHCLDHNCGSTRKSDWQREARFGNAKCLHR